MSRPIQSAMEQVHRLIGPGASAALADTQLLADFVARRDEKSFEVLVWRHSGLVLGTCGRVLRDSHAAEDAFQATFLVFARKASSIGRGESLAGWLHRTATRIALRSLAKSRRTHAHPLPDVPNRESNDSPEWSDLRPVLDEEIGRLPEKYRVPFVLCYLEGQTNEAAAKQLGCPKGTILSRLARGRDWLKSRLLRRGIALSAFAIPTTANASTPLVTSTVAAAIPFAAGTALAGLVSPTVANLTQGALNAMILSPLKFAAAAVLLGSVALAATALGSRAGDEPQRDSAVAVAPAAAPSDAFTDEFFADDEPRRERPVGPPAQPNDLVGRVASVNKDGSSFSIEQPPKERGGKPTKVDVKIGAKTTVVYQGVGLNGAKPTEGYQARVDFDEKKTTAKSIAFQGRDTGRGAGTYGIVKSVKDKSVILQTGALRGGGVRGTDAEFSFDTKTVILFSNVPKDGAKIVEGMLAWVQLVDGTTNNTAGQITFSPSEQRARPETRISVFGKLISGDDKSLTIESGGRGEEPMKRTVKISDKSEVRYFNVIVGGAKPTEGMQAQVWFEGANETAAIVTLTGTPPQRWTTIRARVKSAAADGSTVTVVEPPMQRGEEPKETTIKLTKETKLSFSNVGPNEAKPTADFYSMIRLVDDSKDTAAEVSFFKPGTGERGR